MSRNILLLLLIFISCSQHAIAQTDYYYYKGQKIPLILNEDKVVVSIPKDCDKASERILSNVHAQNMINDEVFGIYVISRSDFEKLTSLDFWEEDSKSVILTSSYFTANNEELYSTPYLTVKLKKEDDKDLLLLYAERYGLEIVRQDSFMLLWYILHVNPETEKSPLECANELYESGDFAESVPDFAGSIDLDTAIRSVASAIPEVSSDLYDLQGRRLTDKPTKGIYIQNGRKYVVVK
jgi:hypothetical protein